MPKGPSCSLVAPFSKAVLPDPRLQSLRQRGERPIRVRLVTERFEPARGGAERSLAQIARHLVRLRVDVEIFCGRAGDTSTYPGIAVESLQESHPTRLAALRRLRSALLDNAPDDRLVHAITPAAPCHLYQVRAGLIPDVLDQSLLGRQGWRVWVARVDSRLRRKWAVMRRWEASLAAPSGRAHIATFTSESAERVRQLYGTSEGRVHVIPNGVDPPPDPPSSWPSIRDRERRVRDLPSRSWVALFAGHDFRRKGLPVLLDAVRRLQPASRPLLLIAGGGATGRLKAAARRVRARFLGPVSPLWPLYHAADTVVVPSLFDPFSRVGLEALACGKSLILSSRDGLAEHVVHRRHAMILRNPTDPDELASHLLYLSQPEVRNGLAAEGHRVASSLTMKAHAENLVRLYRYILHDKPGLLRSPP